MYLIATHRRARPSFCESVAAAAATAAAMCAFALRVFFCFQIINTNRARDQIVALFVVDAYDCSFSLTLSNGNDLDAVARCCNQRLRLHTRHRRRDHLHKHESRGGRLENTIEARIFVGRRVFATAAANELLRRQIADEALAARPDAVVGSLSGGGGSGGGGLSAFKADNQHTGSMTAGSDAAQISGYGSPAYWAGFGAGAAAGAAATAAGGSGDAAASAPEMSMSANFQAGGGGYGAGAIGTPQSPYAGYLEKQIASYPVMIYTLNECMPCQRAKQLLAVHYPDIRAHFLELSGNEAWQQQLQMDLQYLTGAMTFPYIICSGTVYRW